MNLDQIGRWLMLAGVILTVSGGAVWLLSRMGLERLPGEIRFEGSGFTCVFPLLASILLSILLTVILNLITRFLH